MSKCGPVRRENWKKGDMSLDPVALTLNGVHRTCGRVSQTCRCQEIFQMLG